MNNAAQAVHAGQPASQPGKRFLLVGNAPYRNRGCEAIVRGTMEILSATFGQNIAIQAGVMASPGVVSAQATKESDDRIDTFPISHVGSRGSLKWWMSQANKRLGTEFQHHTRDLNGRTRNVDMALQIGGDNYSLDYGRPWDYMAVDKVLQKQGIPVVLWGASVGPFDKDPEFKPIMLEHLKGLSGIFVRETLTQAYLRDNGVSDNVHLVADPAFLMKPVEPEDADVRALVDGGDVIGINVSPLVARFSDLGGDLDAWRARTVEMIVSVAEAFKRPVLLVPHVGAPKPGDDDFAFLESVHALTKDKTSQSVSIVPHGLSGPEMKWLIGHCHVFAGARTHSTIAGLSSCVPTFSMSYSIKAMGINQDLFGHHDFCKSVAKLPVETFVDCIGRMIDERDDISAHLEQKMVEMKAGALRGGQLLAEMI
ncbi:MAG: polysaccharide pyruvyl transferase family protein [Henriciella sp.]|nr:polysaccharide pyruvyl transferase family protein [Henriciella sp.]